jgi:hypothetical protein
VDTGDEDAEIIVWMVVAATVRDDVLVSEFNARVYIRNAEVGRASSEIASDSPT